MLAGVLGGAGVVLAGLLVIVGSSFAGADDGTPEVGECVAITDDSKDDLEYETTGCGTAASDHKVAQVRQNYTSCGNGDYSEITQGSTRLCLIPDVAVGDCQRLPGATSGGVSVPTGIDTKVPCGSPEADVKIVTSVRSGIGESACPEDTENYSAFNDPPKTICLKWLH
ncbi:hypothetical protein [Saccharopolyspora gloriosae]|uniref:LppU/SCO3897 family protein n=1 Tax=Saccharopolyspora gloriosae TaxID=455344 RepID=UPI001FB5D236|nr:hypothetical protein [Saccharopolyspora gloriosae]